MVSAVAPRSSLTILGTRCRARFTSRSSTTRSLSLTAASPQLGLSHHDIQQGAPGFGMQLSARNVPVLILMHSSSRMNITFLILSWISSSLGLGLVLDSLAVPRHSLSSLSMLASSLALPIANTLLNRGFAMQ